MAHWYVYEHLKEESSSAAQWGNHAAEPGFYSITAPLPKVPQNILLLDWIIFGVQDPGPLDADLFGSGEPLTNGLRLVIREGEEEIADLFAGETVKSNGDWARLCYETTTEATKGIGVQTLGVSCNLGHPARPLLLDPGESLTVVVQDDLSTVLNVSALVRGIFPFRCPNNERGLLNIR